MHCLLLFPSNKLLRKPTHIAPSDRCPRKPMFADIEPSRTIVVVESRSRKLPLLPNDCARKPVPNVEPCFLVMSVQKIQRPQTHDKFVMPTSVPTNLRRFDERELLFPLLLIRNPSFCVDPGHMLKTEWLLCKCVGLRFSSILMIGQKTSIKEDILVWLKLSKLSWALICSKLFFGHLLSSDLKRGITSSILTRFKWFKGCWVHLYSSTLYLQTPETKEALRAHWHTTCSVTGLFTLGVFCEWIKASQTRWPCQ